MSDRFDFLELDNSRPLRAAQPASVPVTGREQTPESRSATAPWKILEIVGGPGSGAGEFASPGGLAVDGAGNLLVADSYNHRVQRITPSGDVHVLGRRGTGLGEFLNPQAVVADSSLGFCVLEQGGCRIQRFGPNGEWQGEFGFRGSGRGAMLAPTAMARGPCGSLFVADTGNNRIIQWSPDDVFVDSFPRPHDGPLVRPLGIAVDRAGRIWIGETPQHRLLVLDALLRPLGSLGRKGVQPGEFREPHGLTVMPDGTVMVADTGNNRVQVLDRDGRPVQVIDGHGKVPRAGAGPLDAPSAVAFREREGPATGALTKSIEGQAGGEIEAYVSDTGNNRVLRLGQERG